MVFGFLCQHFKYCLWNISVLFWEITLVNTEFGYSILSFQLDNLDQQELASRLTLNCVDDYVQPQMLRNIPVMIMDVGDFTRI